MSRTWPRRRRRKEPSWARARVIRCSSPPSRRNKGVGWVERSETHHLAGTGDDGFRKGSTHPTCRSQSDVHHVHTSLPAAKATTQPTRPRKIQTAKSTCFLNSFSPSLNRV